MNPKLKNALVFGGGVIATLLAVKLLKAYVLPKTPAAVQSAAAKILP